MEHAISNEHPWLLAVASVAVGSVIYGVPGHHGGHQQGGPEANLLLVDDVADSEVSAGHHWGNAFSDESIAFLSEEHLSVFLIKIIILTATTAHFK